ncbi:STAS domain-containing protein [Herbidospora sp. NBRC 101105]|uniref:STAS domain-containing protein n=1 Tax=Herbidospora sp. NBRC 101105 TaxID=3032195 RepID=UPI0024A4207B|nr:STAS domain-containing protein [Herbidospora sp. NBRC 101105]GLX98860.1 anti-sigma factor antagonist [Herbidospora sp. NBRC 101105]
METAPFLIEIENPEPDTTRLTLSGDFDYTTSGELAALTPTLMSRGLKVLEVDLNGVTFIDSSGLATLIHLFHAAEEVPAEMRFVGMTPYIAHLFEVTALDQVFNLPTSAA